LSCCCCRCRIYRSIGFVLFCRGL